MTAAAGRAGLPRRLAALLYEALLLTAILFVIGFAMLPLVSPRLPGGAVVMPPLPARVAMFCAVFGVLAAYFSWCWSDARQTLAQKAWRLTLVRRDNTPLDRRTALARYLAGWIGPSLAVVAYLVLQPRGLGAHAAWLVAFNFLFAFIDRERQFLHDRIAGTVLIRAMPDARGSVPNAPA